jgi:uncharacterized protein
MIRAVLDTNVLASGASNAKGPSGLLFLAWRRRGFSLVTSEHILAELDATLDDRYFRKRLTSRERQAFVPRLRRQAWVTEITAEVAGVAPSAEDDLVLATAKSAGAEYVVTGDESFQALGSWEGIQIVSPRQFLDILRLQGL